eukprot:5876059-Prymnesium_polylepis.2
MRDCACADATESAIRPPTIDFARGTALCVRMRDGAGRRLLVFEWNSWLQRIRAMADGRDGGARAGGV